MDKLIERIERASRPDREIDRAIAEAVGWKHRSGFPWEKVLDWERPDYTASLDAAMTLVPEGWRWMAGHREHPHARAYVENGAPAFVGFGSKRNPNRLWFETTAATPALALCAAALRARASVGERDGD